jgi:hypothetical protein
LYYGAALGWAAREDKVVARKQGKKAEGTMRKKIHGIVGLVLLCIGLASCSKHTEPPKAENAPLPPAPESSVPSATSVAPDASAKSPGGVKTEMRNVKFHLLGNAAAHLVVLSGELWPTGKKTVVDFDDKTSFEVRVSNGTVSISPEALSDIMNNYVFARKDAPLKDLTVAIDKDKDRLIIKGKLHSKGDIPFGTAGTLSVTSDGRLRVHTEKITALKVPLKGVMGLFGIELANVVNTSKIEGMDTDKNDLLMDLGSLLPPPHIRGKVTGVRIDANAIITTFGDGGKSLPAPKEKVGYMAFQGSTVRFGNMVMEPADLTVLDLDPGGPLDWNQDRYKDQLVAGYSKITPSFGLKAYVKDFYRLGKGGASADLKPPGE